MILKSKVVIIGDGKVGITILHTLMMQKKHDLNLFLIAHHQERSRGDIEDLRHCLCENVKINMGEYSDLRDADILVIASGIKNSCNRTKFLQESYSMISEIVGQINKYQFKGNIIVVSNPNDVLTTYVSKNYYEPN